MAFEKLPEVVRALFTRGERVENSNKIQKP